jgi:hypothetical protein
VIQPGESAASGARRRAFGEGELLPLWLGPKPKSNFSVIATGGGHDRNQIALMAEELPAGIDWHTREPRLRAMTRMLVRRHRTRIERAAQALLTHRSLSAKNRDRLVGRSVADVKVNAPDWWLAKYGKTLKT